MTNPMINPYPNYSGVTINISNPAVNVGGGGNNKGYPVGAVPQYNITNPIQHYQSTENKSLDNQNPASNQVQTLEQNQNPTSLNQTGYPSAYPQQYYLNNYNYQENGKSEKEGLPNTQQYDNNKLPNNDNFKQVSENRMQTNPNDGLGIANKYDVYANDGVKQNEDMTKSQNIIGDISEREAAIEEEKKNTKETKIIALTDEYIKSLENYLNNPNQEIRLMASKEILTRLDEDKDRYDDAALNALLNKMLQDPSKLIRIAALSAFASQLASGNDYTVQLLHNIQSNPNADKEDVLQAADILLKMSAGTEIKNIPNPKIKEAENK